MKIWTSEHTFDHPWTTVVNAAFRKYPNPMNGAIKGIDVVDQNIDAGVLKTERVLQSHFHIPSWATKLTGFSGTQFSREYTEIDPANRVMTLSTRNLNGMNFMRVDERLTYTPDPSNPSRTVLKQEASVVVNLPAFTDYCEKAFINVYQTNALKGRSGVEWVIDQLKREYNTVTNKVSTEVHEMMNHLKSR
ncbi:PRELI/MSF1 domain-containing protein [Aphelenchoides besseyi]|nr:PRELI/MSF1 domain-containing protein [Aphelenchoides besseyi]KAI6225592.1 PRELI/MSF1 domain-containing protein [Aphelenchoides besseyi]